MIFGTTVTTETVASQTVVHFSTSLN